MALRTLRRSRSSTIGVSPARPRHNAAIVPVYYELPPGQPANKRKKVYIIVGSPLPPGTNRAAVDQEIQRLGRDFKEQHRLGTLQQMNAGGAYH